MKLTNEIYVHNRLIFEENEKEILWFAIGIVSAVLDSSSRNYETVDSHLSEICEVIIENISELLDNYSNEYPKNDLVHSNKFNNDKKSSKRLLTEDSK